MSQLMRGGRMPALVAAALLSVVVGACGGESESSGTTEGGGTTAADGITVKSAFLDRLTSAFTEPRRRAHASRGPSDDATADGTRPTTEPMNGKAHAGADRSGALAAP